ncbi:unnamed protein product [Gemmataceae bacterium]|nr:unnamed protein product [Gemmataceae bacterium]VTT99019.1 unnamed protein product [Gemmataceae bacterium]
MPEPAELSNVISVDTSDPPVLLIALAMTVHTVPSLWHAEDRWQYSSSELDAARQQWEEAQAKCEEAREEFLACVGRHLRRSLSGPSLLEAVRELADINRMLRGVLAMSFPAASPSLVFPGDTKLSKEPTSVIDRGQRDAIYRASLDALTAAYEFREKWSPFTAPAEEKPGEPLETKLAEGPFGGRWLVVKGKKHPIPEGVVYRLMAHMWHRTTASYDNLMGSHGAVWEASVNPQSVRSKTSEVSKIWKKLGVPWRLSADSESREIKKLPV